MERSHVPATKEKEPRDRSASVGGGEARRSLLEGLPVTERQLRLNGITTSVLEGGEGPPVVLLHGPGEYAAKWFRVIPDLAASHRIIAPDLPGHGASGGFDRASGLGLVLGWLDDLVECTCPEPPALVGHVLGGALAARFAAERGDRIRRLVLVDSLGLAPFRPAPEFGQALTGFLANPSADSHDRLWTRCAFDLDALRGRLGERWDWIKAYNLDRARDPEIRSAQQVLLERFGMTAIPEKDLAGIPVPTALIWGRHDMATRLTVAEAAAARYGWPIHVIENAADDPVLEQPEAFLNALQITLQDSLPPSPEEESRS